MRRKLLFDIPKGPEVPYWKIKGRIIGEVWAPIYHAYSYYMPASARTVNRDPEGLSRSYDVSVERWDRKMKRLTRDNLQFCAYLSLPWLLVGWKPFLKLLVGGIAWSELESMFSYWDSNGDVVSFGSSHFMFYAIGYLYGQMWVRRKKKYDTQMLVMFAASAFLAYDTLYPAFFQWKEAGYKATDPLETLDDIHYDWPFRTDHAAHVGGFLAGFAASALL